MKIHRQDGYSLIELVISVTVVSILTLTIGVFFVNATLAWTRNNTETRVQADNQLGLDEIGKAISGSSGVLEKNTITDSYGSWTSNVGGPIVLATPALNSAGAPLFATTSGGQSPADTDVCNNETIIFKSGTQVFIRTLANTSSGCNAAAGNITVSTCGAGDACPDKDKTVAEHTDSIGFAFEDGNTCILNLPACRYLTATLNTSLSQFGRTYTATNQAKKSFSRDLYKQVSIYIDSSVSYSAGSGWTNPTHAFDGVDATQATTSSSGGGVLTGAGSQGLPYNNDAAITPTTTSKILKVEARVLGTTTNGKAFSVVLNNFPRQSGCAIESFTINAPLGLSNSWSPYTLLDIGPANCGWFMSQIVNIWANVEVPSGAAVLVGVGDIELRITFI